MQSQSSPISNLLHLPDRVLCIFWSLFCCWIRHCSLPDITCIAHSFPTILKYPNRFSHCSNCMDVGVISRSMLSSLCMYLSCRLVKMLLRVLPSVGRLEVKIFTMKSRKHCLS